MQEIPFDKAFEDITKDVVKIPKKEYLQHGAYPIIDQGDGQIAGYSNREDGLYTDIPVVLFGDHTRIFKYIDFPFFAGADGTKILKAKQGTDTHFGYYSFLQYPLISLGYSRHFKLLKERPFHTFDYATQLRIAGVLGSIDEKIELNRKKIAELEALAKTIYDYWFVQFDFPDAHGNPYKSSGGKMVWNEQLKREVPEGWEVKELGGIATFANGINYTNADQCGKTYRIVNVRDISASTIYIHEDGLSEVTLPETLADRYLIPDNSIIIARSGCPGAIRLLSNGGNIIFCGFIIVCKPKLMSSRIYLMFCLKSLEGSSVTHKDSSILNNVSQDMLKRVVLAIPDVMVLQKFNDILSPILKRITTLQGETSQVIKLRDMLLPILMNGQAKVESSK